MKQLSFLALLVLISPSTQAALWFTDQPPDKALLAQLQHAHGGMVQIEKDVYYKQLWLRKGEDLLKAS